MQGNIVAKYTTDGGSTWSTPVTLKCTRVKCWLRWEKNSELSTKSADGYVCEQGRARLMVLVELDVEQFDLTVNPSTADTLYVTVNKLRCASQIHIYTTVNVDGFSDVAASNNTYYLTPDDIPDVEFEENDGNIRIINFTLKARQPYTI